MDTFDVVIVGGGPATRIFNKYLHFFRPEIRTVVIRDEERIVNHCGTPYILEGKIEWERGLISEDLVTRFGTPIVVDPVVGGSPEEKYVECASGRKIGYGTLVFATGTDQVLPPIPGIDLPGVLKVRRTEDLTASMKFLEPVEKVVVLGGGYIGLEFAQALRHLGKEVALVELESHVMGGRIDGAMAEALEEELRKMGVELFLGRKAARVRGKERVEALELEDGGVLSCGALLAAVGVKPMVDYAPAFGLETTPQGIVVDEYFFTGVENIYAMGDCVQTFSRVTGRPVPGKLGSNAGQMARRLALNLSGRKAPFPGVTNVAVTRVGELAYGSAGLTEEDAGREGISILVTRNKSTDIYDNMPGNRPVEAKLVFREEDLLLLGGELLHPGNPAGFLEALGQMVERRATLEEVITMSYSSHPELTPKTSKPFFVWAAEPLFKKLASSGAFQGEADSERPVASGR